MAYTQALTISNSPLHPGVPHEDAFFPDSVPRTPDFAGDAPRHRAPALARAVPPAGVSPEPARFASFSPKRATHDSDPAYAALLHRLLHDLADLPVSAVGGGGRAPAAGEAQANKVIRALSFT